MRGDSGGLTHVDHALNAALLAADVALRGGDKAGLMTFDDVPRAWLKPTGGRSGGRKLTRAVYALEAGLGATDFRAGTAFLQTQMRARSLVVMFTNLIDARSAKELSAAVRSLMPRHLPLCVFMRDTDIEALANADVTDARDLYMRAAAAESLIVARRPRSVAPQVRRSRARREAGRPDADAREELPRREGPTATLRDVAYLPASFLARRSPNVPNLASLVTCARYC